ncbi:hypothetical protein [Pseudoalteromonas fuliginea]|uniref:hypothetical protein n=1 Tax=Pseudoalteromonas fuliginea TaxID=1872678 RepID=UPI000AD5225F|nr:hypothetical protein [Pseudoalteromonas fuliginea]
MSMTIAEAKRNRILAETKRLLGLGTRPCEIASQLGVKRNLIYRLKNLVEGEQCQ